MSRWFACLAVALLVAGCTADDKHSMEEDEPAPVFLWHSSCAANQAGQVALGEVCADESPVA